MTGRRPRASDHNHCTESSRSPDTPGARLLHLQLIRRWNPESGNFELSVRSLFDSEKHLLHFTNFFTLTQMCQPPSVSPCSRVLAYFHKYFQQC
jgi:hypothetical protein